MNTVTEKLLELFEEETGIRIASEHVSIELDNDDIVLFIWDEECIRIEAKASDDVDSEATAERLLAALYDEYFDIREHLIEIKLDALRATALEPLQTAVVEKLQSSTMTAKVLDALDFDFMDVSDADKDFGSPKLALRVTDFEKFECFIPVSASEYPLQLDSTTILKEIYKKI